MVEKKEGVNIFQHQENYAETMRKKGYSRFTTWVPDADKEKVTRFTAKIRREFEAEKVEAERKAQSKKRGARRTRKVK